MKVMLFSLMAKEKIAYDIYLKMIFQLLSTPEPFHVIFMCYFRETIDYVPNYIPFFRQEFAISRLYDEV